MHKLSKRGVIVAVLSILLAVCAALGVCLMLPATSLSDANSADNGKVAHTGHSSRDGWIALTSGAASYTSSGHSSETNHGNTAGAITGDSWESLSSDGELGSYGETDYYYLADNVNLGTDITIVKGATVYLCLNGFMLTGTGNSSVITIMADAEFYLCDCGGTALQTRYFYKAAAEYSFTNKEQTTERTFTVTGTVYKYCSVAKDDGDCDDGHGSHEAIKGGVITGGKVTDGWGGGIRMLALNAETNNGANVGTLYMYGGTVAGNQAVYKEEADSDTGGGGIASRGGSVYIYGGAVTGNFSADRAGGIGIYSGGTLEMANATISDNYSGDAGGGVYASGTATITNTSITGNTASTAGGGIYAVSGSAYGYTLKDVTITGNHINSSRYETVQYGGGGAWLNGCTVSISGKIVITGNTFFDRFADDNAGATISNNVCMISGKTLTVVGELTEGTSIGIFLNSGTNSESYKELIAVEGTATTGYSDYNTTDPPEFFFSDKTDYFCVYLSDGEAAIGVHKYGGWDTGDDANHTRTCTQCGHLDEAGHNWSVWSDNCDAGSDGVSRTHSRECSVCTAVQTADHDWGNWLDYDDDSHYSTCESNNCTAVKYQTHTYELSDLWDSDDQSCTHSKKCDGCDYRKRETHSFDNGTEYNQIADDDNYHNVKCDYCEFTAKDEHIWALADGAVTDCTTATLDWQCTLCGYTKTEDNATPAHSTSYYSHNNPSCTENGNLEYWYCGLCGKYFCGSSAAAETVVAADDVTIPALGHDAVYNAGKAPTCEKDGWEEYYTCTRCDFSTYQAIEALGHDWATREYLSAATCGEEGYICYETYCTKYGSECTDGDCTEVLSSTYIYLPPTGHSWDEGTVTLAATCETAGEITYTCTVCSESVKEETAAPGHIGAEAVKENVTDTGYELAVYCANCGKELSRTAITTGAAATGEDCYLWFIALLLAIIIYGCVLTIIILLKKRGDDEE